LQVFTFAPAWRKSVEMSSPSKPEDLLDLRLLPAWVNEPPRLHEYANFEGDDGRSFERGDRRPGRRRDGQSRPNRPPDSRDSRGPRDKPQSRDSRGPQSRERRPRPPGRDAGGDRRPSREPRQGGERREQRPAAPPIAVTVRFLPHPPPVDSVVAQIKSGLVAYSVFALARLFLEKPERYDVKLTTPEGQPLFQLGEQGAVASDRQILEGGAFASARDDFYTVEVTQTEPLKGNFTNVARCRLSGTLLGPTNHHNYQPQLRSLYEGRFSRRMSFFDYQKQIDIVSDPAVVEEWKEQARTVTTYTAKTGEPPLTFTNPAEVERHFRKTYLPDLIRSTNELTIDGVLSRRLPDRALGSAIEQAWVDETRSPSKMMQELVGGLRQAGLHIFRHRRGMLFVSPVRARAFSHESTGVSASINNILEKVAAAPGINRKKLAEQLAQPGADPADHERAKLSLAADLHWLVSEGYVIEFNDGSLDLPKTKQPVTAQAAAGKAQAVEKSETVEQSEPTAEPQPVEDKKAEITEAVQSETPVAEEPPVVAQAADGKTEAVEQSEATAEPQPVEDNKAEITELVQSETPVSEEPPVVVTTADPAEV
jgi:hypothetical protein